MGQAGGGEPPGGAQEGQACRAKLLTLHSAGQEHSSWGPALLLPVPLFPRLQNGHNNRVIEQEGVFGT